MSSAFVCIWVSSVLVFLPRLLDDFRPYRLPAIHVAGVGSVRLDWSVLNSGAGVVSDVLMVVCSSSLSASESSSLSPLWALTLSHASRCTLSSSSGISSMVTLNFCCFAFCDLSLRCCSFRFGSKA
ncbi:hypothetical protein C8Q79DRAFT_38331 [Trametes meyenii]|nr:hypothetical protein C8Q79DRAFT_38331 [Trametes meyenii]